MANTIQELMVKLGLQSDGLTTGLDGVQAKAAQFSMKVTGLLAGISFGAIFAGLAASAEAFQEAGFKIARSTGATGEHLAELNQSLKTLYSTSAASAETIGESLATISRETGATGVALESLTKANMQFAKVTGTDVKQAIDATQVAFKQWGIAATDQASKLDVLYRIQTLTGISTEALGAEMAATGATTRAFGFTFEESVALIGAFEEAGLKASDMVKGLNGLFVKFSESGKNPQEALAALIKKLGDTASSAQAVNELIEAGFAKRAAVAMADAARRGALEFDGLTKKLQDASGAVSEMAKNTTSLTAEFTKFWHGIEVGLSGPGTGVLGWLTSMAHAFNDVASKIGTMSTLFAGGFGAAALLADAQKLDEYHKKNLAGQTFGAKPVTGSGGGGAAPTGPPEFLHASTMDTMIGVDRIEANNAALKKLISTLAEYAVNGQNVATVTSKIDENFITLGPLAQAAGVSIAAIADADWSNVHVGIKRTDELMQQLGVSSTGALQAIYQGALQAEKELYLLYLQNQATDADMRTAAEAVAQAHKNLNVQINGTAATYTAATKKGIDFGKQVSTVLTDLSRQLADVVMGEKSIGDAFKDVGKAIVRIILEDIISNAIGKLMKALSGVLSSLGGIGKAIGGVFSGGGGGGVLGTSVGAAGGAASTIGGAVSSGGGAASGIAGAAGSSFSSIAGLVTGAVSAVSGVIGNFQMAGMNKTLDLIENYTRYLKIGLVEQGDSLLNDSHVIRNTLTTFMRWNWDIATTYFQAISVNLDKIAGGSFGGGSGGAGAMTFNNCTFNGVTQDLAGEVMAAAFRSTKATTGLR